MGKPIYGDTVGGGGGGLKKVPQSDWAQTDETQLDYIKNKPGIENGLEENSTQQHGSEAISEGATAFGANTFAGLKGFVIAAFDEANNSYTLATALPDEIVAGTVFSAQVKNNYYKWGKITAISDDKLTITVDNYIPDVASSTATKVIWFADYPNAGTEDLGKYAYSAGANTKAVQYGATALGIDTEAAGKYSTALGRETEAHYAALAAGYRAKATAEEAIAMGYETEASGKVSTSFGWGTKATQETQFVAGRYNDEAKNTDALFVIGNGEQNAKSNAFTVNRDGTASIKTDPIKDENVANKKYVDINTVPLGERLDAIEDGYTLLKNNDRDIVLPTFIDDTIRLNTIGGNTIVGRNKANPLNIVFQDAEKNGATGKQLSIDKTNGTITLGYEYTNGATNYTALFSYGIWVDFEPNTEYRISLNSAYTKGTLNNVFFYTDYLWGTQATLTSGSTPTNITNTNTFVFNPGKNTRLLLGFYSALPRTETEVLPLPMITKVSDDDTVGVYIPYEPYVVYPSKVTKVTTYEAGFSELDSYIIPEYIQNDLPGYGYSGNVVDFNKKIYTYVTEDGITRLDYPKAISLYDYIPETPTLKVSGGEVVGFSNSQDANIPTSIFYKKPDTAISVIDNLTSEDSESALSANQGRVLAEKVSEHEDRILMIEKIVGIKETEFVTIEGESITVPDDVLPNAQVLEIHGNYYSYDVSNGYYSLDANPPTKLISDNGDVLLEIPESVGNSLPDFGLYYGNYIYFDGDRVIYHREYRRGAWTDSTPYDPDNLDHSGVGEGETQVVSVYDGGGIYKLASVEETDITDKFNIDGIINIKGVQNIAVVLRDSEQYVKDLADYAMGSSGGSGNYSYRREKVKITFEV